MRAPRYRSPVRIIGWKVLQAEEGYTEGRDRCRRPIGPVAVLPVVQLYRQIAQRNRRIDRSTGTAASLFSAIGSGHSLNLQTNT